MERIERGEIRWCSFDKPNKTRPVLVLTQTPVIRHLNEVNVAAITTAIRHAPSQVLLDESDGMPEPCAINLYQLHTIDKRRLGKLIVQIREETLEEVRAALLFAMGFNE